jgi:hypothetical protein
MFPLGRWNEVKKTHTHTHTHTQSHPYTQIAFPKQNDFALK